MSQAFNQELPLISTIPLGRTSKQIKAEIESKLGFVPPFFEPAEQNPQVLENLWQQTLAAYVNNPLSALFKEKLFAYLSRFCTVPYCLICHSCSLRPLGMSAQEVLKLLEAPPPTATDVEKQLSFLAAQSKLLTQSNTKLEESLLSCAIFIALQDQTQYCRQELRQILGAEKYQHLVALIAYIKTCHVWMEAYPEVALEADKRVQDCFSALLEQEPDLAHFFSNYQEKVRREYQSRTEQRAELAERQRQEEAWRQQAERERLVAEIARRIRQSLNLEEILSTTVFEVRQFLQTERVFVYRFEPDWSGFVVVESVAPGWNSILGIKCKDSFFAETLSRELYIQGRSYAVEDIYAAELSQCHVDLLTQLQIRADLVVPIVQGEELWGLLVANQCSEPRQWQQMEIDLLKQLATQVAIAIQQSTLYEQVQSELAQRQRSEQTVREQAALLDIATDAILVQGLEQEILFWNQGAERLYGWSSQEVLSQNAARFLYKNSLQPQEVQLVFQDGSWQGELHQLTKFGKEIVVSSRWTLVRDERGQPKSILIVNTDITEKKQLEAQFLRAQRLESLGTLASGIAHDLNNILTPIMASAQLLSLMLPDAKPESQHLFELIETNTKRGAELVKQVLSFAQGVEGKQRVLSIQPLIVEIQKLIENTFPKTIAVQTHIPTDLWAVYADATQLHQVLMNLVINARDAMPRGGTLRIAAENFLIDENYARINLDASVGPHVVITVADTGTGIPPEIQDKIFDPFFTTKEIGRGTGLGLSTVLGLVRSHGGFVKVNSPVGQGTQFQIYLPASEAAPAIPPQELDLLNGRGEMILVVDDEAPIREVTLTVLKAHNYQVLTAGDGVEAISLYVQHQERISAVLMDLMMPSMDGLTTMLTLQKLNPTVKAIATSGLGTSVQVAKAKGIGVQAFLPKPYTAEQLLRVLHEVLT